MDLTSYLLGKKKGGGGTPPVLITKNITANGTYNASDDNADGYSQAVVNVPTGITPTGNINITNTNVTDVTNYATAQVVDSDLVAENIKKDVNILGVTGSYEGSGGADLSDYFDAYIRPGSSQYSGIALSIKRLPSNIQVYGTSLQQAFKQCSSLIEIPLIDTQYVTAMNSAFNNCGSLTTVPILNTSSVTNFSSMFNGCSSLTDQSLDNILVMCINATSYTGTKTLATLGFYSGTAKVSRIEALPHYQDFIDAGWTIGYS